MKCIKCKNEINGNTKYCPNCGALQEKNGLSLVTKISLIVLIIVALFFILINVYSFMGSTKNEAFGWLIGINAMTAMLIVPYYLIVFFVSLVCDNKGNLIKTIRNIVIPILLILPIIWIIIHIIFR